MAFKFVVVSAAVSDCPSPVVPNDAPAFGYVICELVAPALCVMTDWRRLRVVVTVFEVNVVALNFVLRILLFAELLYPYHVVQRNCPFAPIELAEIGVLSNVTSVLVFCVYATFDPVAATGDVGTVGVKPADSVGSTKLV